MHRDKRYLAKLGIQIDFDCGVTTAVKDFTSANLHEDWKGIREQTDRKRGRETEEDMSEGISCTSCDGVTEKKNLGNDCSTTFLSNEFTLLLDPNTTDWHEV